MDDEWNQVFKMMDNVRFASQLDKARGAFEPFQVRHQIIQINLKLSVNMSLHLRIDSCVQAQHQIIQVNLKLSVNMSLPHQTL